MLQCISVFAVMYFCISAAALHGPLVTSTGNAICARPTICSSSSDDNGGRDDFICADDNDYAVDRLDDADADLYSVTIICFSDSL